MGWVPLPYGSAGLARRSDLGNGKSIWSWLVLIPWSDDAKPWIDGTKMFGPSLKDEAGQKEDILAHMRSLLDKRYGETMGQRAADELIERILEED
jgi:hypothetical protein